MQLFPKRWPLKDNEWILYDHKQDLFGYLNKIQVEYLFLDLFERSFSFLIIVLREHSSECL